MHFLVWAIMLVIPSVAFAETISVSFGDLPRMIWDQNRRVEGERDFLEESKRRQGHLQRSFLPKVNVEGGGETFKTGPYSTRSEPHGGAEATINLFRGGRDRLEENVRAANTRSASASVQDVYLRELMDARRTYLELLYQQEMLQLARESLQQNRRYKALALKRIEGGLATATDRLEFEMTLVELSQEVARHEVEVAASENRLAAQLHLPAGTTFNIHKMNQHDEHDFLLKKEFRPDTHRQVQILKAQKDAAYNEMKRRNRWWTPAVEVGGGYALYTLREREYTEWRDRREGVVGINVRLQPFDGLHAHSEARAAAQKMKGYETWADQTSRNLESDYESERQRMELLHRLLHQGEQGVVQGRTYLDRTLSEYTDGVKNSTDVIVATQKYFDFRKRYVTLRRDYQLARSNLMSLLGE